MITDEERTFFTLKFGTDPDKILDDWIHDIISLTREERYILAEMHDVTQDKLLAAKAILCNIDSQWYDDDD